MNKIFSQILIIALCLVLGNTVGNCEVAKQNPAQIKHERMKKEFEQRLNLTDKQKIKAKEIHQKGREQIKPIIDKIELDKLDIEKINQSKLSTKEKQEKIEELNSDIKNLQKQAGEIRKKNSQEFEKILNKKQKEELAKMKAEGRARFEKMHPSRPPFAGLGVPNFLLPRPVLPQLNSN